ncbi:MAG TPA: hypothetical protein VGN32_00295, partial [Ktedonobacterales bacterium]|nr:hypothetical protein [Ktedonobacterales bacterium]
MRHVRRRFLGVIGVALTLGMLLSGCGGVRTTTGGRVAAASTATATDTPLPTATTSAATVESA